MKTLLDWIPACAGMTRVVDPYPYLSAGEHLLFAVAQVGATGQSPLLDIRASDEKN